MLENNHESMKTVVETFLTEETVDLIYDNEQLDKWNNHVKELGLTGQTQIVKGEKSPIPFMHLKKSYKNICETICPRKVSINAYNVTPIPVEILELVALSKKECYFDEIEVWYDEKSPDPFVIGIKATQYYVPDGTSYKYFTEKSEASEFATANNKQLNRATWNDNFYLLGKWADVKRSWNELKEMAKTRFMEAKANDYHKTIKEAKRGLEDLEQDAFTQFN